MYFVPVGSTLPDGQKLKEGEWVQLKYSGYYDSKELSRLHRFFNDKRNLTGWIKQYDERGSDEESSDADS